MLNSGIIIKFTNIIRHSENDRMEVLNHVREVIRTNHFFFSPYVDELRDQTILIPVNGENWLGDLRHQNDVAGMALQLQWYTLPSLENLKIKNRELINLLKENFLLHRIDTYLNCNTHFLVARRIDCEARFV